MPSNTLTHYQDACQESGIFSATAAESLASADTYVTYRVAQGLGNGWMDLLQIGPDMAIGRAAYSLDTSVQQLWQAPAATLAIFVMLSGAVRFTRGAYSETLEGGSLWLRDGRYLDEEICYELPAGKSLIALSIDVPPAWLEAQTEVVMSGPAQRSAKASRHGLFRRLQGDDLRRCLSTAQALINLRPNSVISRLRLEALALELTAALLGLSWTQPGRPLPRRHRAAAEDAVDILCQELDAPHTIACLARRVGLNECALKSAFRRVTGTTIAAYLREQRMRRAHLLIEQEGYNVQQAALAVGYSNPSHFAAAFRQIHGIEPSRLR